MPETNSKLWSLLKKIALSLGVWTLVAVGSSAAIYFESRSRGNVRVWWRVFLRVLPYWYFLSLMTPMIFWQGRKLAVRGNNWLKVIALNALAGFGWVSLFGAVFVSYELWLDNLPKSDFLKYYKSIFGFGFLMDYFCYSAIVVTGYASQFYQQSRQQQSEAARLQLANSQLETQLAQSQLQALKAQLHPHFLFNTLNTIAALVRRDEKHDAVNMLTSLGDLLRQTMNSDQQQFVTLRQELEFLRRYLEIQQVRFREQLRVELNIQPEAMEAFVPNLILQPLVENAIRHGIAENLETGRLSIVAARTNGKIEISVYNDGPELPPDWRMEANAGIGLSNTRQRLSKLYGDDFSFDLKSVAERGVMVTLELPAETI
jgi:two-component system LytT family sensor kinase